MNETTKTLSYIGVALIAVGVAWASRPATPTIGKDDVVGQQVSSELKDPLAAKSLEIIDYDPDTGSPKAFKVHQVKGVWSLPSHFDYPADAQQQLSQAASSLMDLKILGVATQLAAEHAEFGVVDPGTAQPGSQGVGKHITLADANGKKLLDLIIGKEVKDQPKLHYVRKPGQDPVYIVAVSTDKLSTRFDDWIEKDLLKLNAWDIAHVFINNYSIDEANRQQVPGEKIDLTFTDKDSKWSLADLKEGEELDTTKLNEMKTAIDDLKIVDVRKKPAGLSRDLRTEEGITLDEQTVGSLISKGFWPTKSGDLLSNEGEVVAGTKDGVEYVLRFGEIALGTESAKDDKAADGKEDADKQAGADKKDKAGNNRYLFLMAQLDPTQIPEPEYTPVPGETQPADPAATEPAAADAPAAPAGDQKPSEGPAGPEPASDQLAQADPAKAPATAENPDTKAEQQPAAEGETISDKKEGDAQDEKKDPAQVDVEKIKAENKRKKDEYETKLKTANDKIKALNDRFADWYYVISDDVYKKIHLSRADCIKKPEPPKPAEGQGTPAELNQLQQGIEAAPAAP